MALDFKSARHWAQELLSEALYDGAAAVDGTMGGGGDTLFLCERVGEAGRVYAFDVQQGAVNRTRDRLAEVGLAARATLLCAGHERVPEFVKEPVDAAVFNLGWLPGGDKSVTTRVETTIAALDGCLALLKPRGILTVCAYPGHPEGEAELRAVNAWAGALPEAFQAMVRAFLNPARPAPTLLAVQRIR
jgi:ubiquinone/menaquinone biosynthesis C-methylase UbiE